MAKDETNRADGECCGLPFYIDNGWKFVVPDISGSYDSYEKMREAVERQEKRVKAAKRTKIALPVVTENGVEFEITGVHSGNYAILLSPKREGDDDGNHYYIDVPWIRAAADKMAVLKSDADAIGDVLKRFEIAEYQGGYRSNYERLIRGDGTPEGLQKLYEERLARATKTDLAKELKIKSKDDDE